MKNSLTFWLGKIVIVLAGGLMMGAAGCHGGPPRLPGLPGLPGIHHGQLGQPQTPVTATASVAPEDGDDVRRMAMNLRTAQLLE